ncbi:MAG: helix-turn-helix domain-containing protein [Polaromonas sp.]|uniref:AraC-like ligand-binding domain-containing protein n=1 Tax=Polaromonas sp. TaxID=1869339 RepID=UPI002731E03C|nr:helix-turn-helix domain-containing protein [Polaromonas sp.]MDP1740599.1 helix-turn-helix domain-containing protein [Polaromonas sp.]MDP1955986.1 helix-turn-helix domain-containing protein [Polaromonas sp.]MDP3247352.1 helix-turn-helix domain-containing protein [Polaromonas sp.]MDP3752031.1 helix-turn-helix domain-containing protein [Polaromonas sp.]
MTAATVVSTDNFAPRERAPVWREWVWKHFGGLESDLYGDTDFDGHMASGHAGDVILTKLEANRHRVVRSADMVRASDEGYFKIVAPLQGRAGVQQMGRSAWVGPGAWTIYDTTGAYAVDNPERVQHLIVMLPKAQLLERGLPLESLMARHVGGASGIARVALATMRSTYQELPHMSAAAARGAGELIAQMVRLSLIELSGQETAVTQREALKDRIRAYVALRLRDPALSIDQIAQALNCSKRHLHNAFADGADTLASYILQMRLQACLRELQQTGPQACPITEIALSWGFNNLSHFSRVFRAHTGLSPSGFRQLSAIRAAALPLPPLRH